MSEDRSVPWKKNYKCIYVFNMILHSLASLRLQIRFQKGLFNRYNWTFSPQSPIVHIITIISFSCCIWSRGRTEVSVMYRWQFPLGGIIPDHPYKNLLQLKKKKKKDKKGGGDMLQKTKWQERDVEKYPSKGNCVLFNGVQLERRLYTNTEVNVIMSGYFPAWLPVYYFHQ